MTFPKTLLPLLAAAMSLGGCVYDEYETVQESPRRVYRGGYAEEEVVVERRPAYDYDDRRESYYDDRPRAYYDDRPRAYGGGGVTVQTTRSYQPPVQVYHDHDAHQRALDQQHDAADRKKEQSKKKESSDSKKKESNERPFEPRIKTHLEQMHTVIAGPRGQPSKPEKDKDDDKKKKKKD